MNPPDRSETARDYLVILFLLIVELAESEGVLRVDE